MELLVVCQPDDVAARRDPTVDSNLFDNDIIRHKRSSAIYLAMWLVD